MKAIIIPHYGSVDVLTLATVDTPKIKANEVLLRVLAIGINPVDAKAREGKAFAAKLQPEFPVILGKDVVGEIIEKGTAVADFEIGDIVFGIANPTGFGKTYAQFVATPTDALIKKPAQISIDEAAASPVAALTALQALTEAISLKKGQHILIHAASGGVGHFAVQIAKHLGAHVTGTSSAANKNYILNELHADAHIDYQQVNYHDYAQKFDVVLDLVGLHNIDNAILTTKPGGEVICIPSNSFQKFKEKIAHKNVNGFTHMMHADKVWLQKLAQLLSEKTITPHISQTFQLEEMKEAHQQIASGKTRGKIIVQVQE
ncbi:NADP-dependent oxidoreductase [Zhouia sp. PK063]|uniref:NADP-dependent oxidoreductase n=1 Tax=Zhouia sp. PK063 TaxID=3373602 RepID=UPI0037A56C6B